MYFLNSLLQDMLRCLDIFAFLLHWCLLIILARQRNFVYFCSPFAFLRALTCFFMSSVTSSSSRHQTTPCLFNLAFFQGVALFTIPIIVFAKEFGYLWSLSESLSNCLYCGALLWPGVESSLWGLDICCCWCVTFFHCGFKFSVLLPVMHHFLSAS